MFSKAICALASNLYAAIKGPFLTATESMFKDTYLAATGKSRKEIELYHEVEKYKVIHEAQELARREMDLR